MVVLVDDRVPLPRAISHQLTGKAAAPAMSRGTAKLPQNRPLSNPAFTASGIRSMIALSTTSMMNIDAVSAASRSGGSACSWGTTFHPMRGKPVCRGVACMFRRLTFSWRTSQSKLWFQVKWAKNQSIVVHESSVGNLQKSS